MGMPHSMNEPVELIRGGLELAPRVEPLWNALFDHHLGVGAAGIATIPRDETWARRLEHYRRLFAEHPMAEFLLARLDGEFVGYAMSYSEGEGERGTMMLETLSLLAEARGRGIGTLLMDTVDRSAAELGLRRSAVEVLGGNTRARDLYLSRGYLPDTESWLRSEPPSGAESALSETRRDAAFPGLRTLAEGVGVEWSVIPGPDDTWVSAREMAALACDDATSPADVERLVEATAEAGFWTVFVEIPAAPLAPALRDRLENAGFRLSTERLTRSDAPD